MHTTRTAILTYAENRESFRFSELLSYLNNISQKSKVSLAWHLKQLVNEGQLYKLGRGIYTSHKVSVNEYIPRLSRKAKSLFKKLSNEFRFISISVFDGNILADFQHHVSANRVIYTEVDRDAMESVSHFLKKLGHRVYINPSKDFVYENIVLSEPSIIIKPLITEAPLIERDNVWTPSLEKILVDVLCDDDLDYLHGSEWARMLENAISSFSLNRTSMLRYASRRNVKDKVLKALENLNNYD